MKIKTSELTVIALDWAVAKCEDSDTSIEHFLAMHSHYYHDHGTFDYSTNWGQGGPIIEREGIGLMPSRTAYYELDGGTFYSYGDTALIAAMRCFVAAKLGDEVEVPDELLS